MNICITNDAFGSLVDSLKRPLPLSESKPYWPYPLPEAEMIARYGLRRLTNDEKQIFPGLCLVLQIYKAAFTKPPAVTPFARAGWAFGELSRAVVWVAETYPDHYLVRFPGGATVLAPFNEMSWMAVADDVPASTLVDAKIAEQQRHWRTAVLRDIHQQLHL